MAKEDTQNNLLVNTALFASSAQAPNATDNLYFRQLLKGFRSDFNLPPIGSNLDQSLDTAFLEKTAEMKTLLQSISRFTLMLNVLEMESDNSLVLCISICFVTPDRLKVMLLDVQPFNLQIQVQSVIEKTLQEYNLDQSQIIRTCVDGSEELNIDLSAYRPIYAVHEQILKIFDEALKSTSITTSVRNMINSFCSKENALECFEEVSGFALDSTELSREKRINLLLKYRAQFFKICSQLEINVISEDEWKNLEDIEELKRVILHQFKPFENAKYVNISSIFLRVRNLLTFLKLGFESLNWVSSILAWKIEQGLASILDFKQQDFNPIYLQATFLNPNFYGALNKEQTRFVKESLTKLICDRRSNLTVEDSNEQIADVKSLINSYHSNVHASHLALTGSNSIQFWMSNYNTYRELADIALEILIIPISTTLPHIPYSTQNPFDFIKMAQNVEISKRNAIIRLNEDLSYQEEPQNLDVDQKRKGNESGEQHFNTPSIGPTAKVPRIYDSPALFVHNVTQENFNCKRVFNLFTCYGDVLKIKFLDDSKKSCIVEMKSIDAAKSVYKYLNYINAFGRLLVVSEAKKAKSVSIYDVGFPMSCGGRSVADFSTLNLSNEMVQANPASPSSKLNFFGPPIDITDDQINQLLSTKSIKGPYPTSIVRHASKAAHFLIGVMSFKNIQQATEAIMLYNFTPIADSNFLNLRYSA